MPARFLMSLLLILVCTLTGCYSREEWGQALLGASDRMLYAPRVYCTTTYGRYSTYTSCY